MNYTIYDISTGQISHTVTSHDPQQLEINLQGLNYIEGNYNPQDYYIDQAQAHKKPSKPTDGMPYTFDYSTRTWQIDIEKAKSQMRIKRQIQLQQVDRVNPMWYATLTTQQQQELAVYRQALLDVPQQAGFPGQVEWPAKPAWL